MGRIPAAVLGCAKPSVAPQANVLRQINSGLGSGACWFFGRFVALDQHAGKPARFVVSARGGYAMALLFAFMFAIIAAPIAKAEVYRAVDRFTPTRSLR